MFKMNNLKMKVLILTATIFVNPVLAADHSLGLTLGSGGLGITGSKKTGWHILDDDQIQFRLAFTGLNSNGSELEISDIDYKSSNVDLSGFQIGADWYPFDNNVFFSAGFIKQDFKLKGTTKSNQALIIGGTAVSSSDNVRLTGAIEQSSTSPYLSVGWGNKLGGDAGFAFHSELGLMRSSDVKVRLTATDPNNVLATNSLANEKKEIQDDYGSLTAFLGLGVSYRF